MWSCITKDIRLKIFGWSGSMSNWIKLWLELLILDLLLPVAKLSHSSHPSDFHTSAFLPVFWDFTYSKVFWGTAWCQCLWNRNVCVITESAFRVWHLHWFHVFYLKRKQICHLKEYEVFQYKVLPFFFFSSAVGISAFQYVFCLCVGIIAFCLFDWFLLLLLLKHTWFRFLGYSETSSLKSRQFCYLRYDWWEGFNSSNTEFLSRIYLHY